MAQNQKRGRNNNNRRRQNGNNPNRSLDSTGPEVKIRGTASQIFEKYQGLARDASSAGDRIRAESLSQHAEHYYRMMRLMQTEDEKREEQRLARNESTGQNQNDDDASRTDNEEDNNKGASRPDARVETLVEKSVDADGNAETSVPAGAVNESDREITPKPRRSRRRRPPARAAADSDDQKGASGSDPEHPVPAE